MNEASKAIARRLHTPGFATHYFVGHGLDVGSGDDSLGQFQKLFPRIQSVTDFDKPDGDAQLLAKHPDATFDFVHSSHCLEHMRDPLEALRNWLRVLRPGGYAVVMVPDEDMYEQGIWPSTFNDDHKFTFTIYKTKSWSPVSVNLFALLVKVADLAATMRLEQLHTTYLPDIGRSDQTMNPVTESAIEFVLRRH
jgi:SAM-dependent methyltransferase